LSEPNFPLIFSAAVVKLKALTSLLAADGQLSNKTVENMKMMQKILVYIVTIISNFMDLEPTVANISQFVSTYGNTLSGNYLASVTLGTTKSADSNWQKKAIVSVMEAGGVNWLVGKVIFHLFNFIHEHMIVLFTLFTLILNQYLKYK
jgi:hypothetical protein